MRRVLSKLYDGTEASLVAWARGAVSQVDAYEAKYGQRGR